ncbi:MAG: hypothetical protein EA383_06060 [Spirochaetaceae bacterium]|nr:MAG: hypothetical protein EA383_06060 [Spirochaetaceae bacterium]
MFFFFGYPIIFLLPFFLALLALRSGSRTLGAHRRSALFGDDLYADSALQRQVRGIEARIFRLAYRMNGVITVSDVVVELGIGSEEAQTFLDALVDSNRVRIDVADDGVVTYAFPEIEHRLNINKAGEQ